MSNESASWTDFLKSQGATGGTFNTLSPAAEAGVSNWLADLADRVVIDVTGADASEFLQAQFCNDVAVLDPVSGTAGQLNGYCNPKGRLLALFHLVAFAEDDSDTPRFRMILPASTADAFVKRLRMFVLRAQVEFTLSDDAYRVFGMSGARVSAALEGLFPANHPTPDAGDYSTKQFPGYMAMKLPADRWMLVVDENKAMDAWNTLSAELQSVGSNRWQLESIDAGEPVLYDTNVEQIIPQMLNLQAINALSFKKGCYPGQEIVARMQYLGKLKRRMRKVMISGDALPDAGAKLAAGDDADAGIVVCAAIGADGNARALVVVKDSVDIAQLSAEGIGGGFAALDLPYTLDTGA